MTVLNKYKAPFLFSSITWREISAKVDHAYLKQMEDVLSKSIDLKDYGTGVKNIGFVYLAIKPDNKLHEEFIEYNPKEKSIYAQIKLPYEQVLEADQEAMHQLMKDTYLVMLQSLADENIPDFDVAKLQVDVQAVFAEAM